MAKTIAKLVLILVGLHVLLGLCLLVVEAIHGINDQDASFALALAFHYLNLPSVWLLRSISDPPAIILVLLVGVGQWAALASVIAVVFHTSRSTWRAIAGRMAGFARPSAGQAGLHR